MSLLDRLPFGRPRPPAEIPTEPVVYQPIGVVRNKVQKSRPDGWEAVQSQIVLRDDLAAALDGLEGFSHAIVVFHMHAIPPEERRDRLVVGTDAIERGVLATRSQLRPNAISVAVVPILHREGVILTVQGLDAINGTPVIDIKPYLPAYDSVPGATLPAWAIAEA